MTALKLLLPLNLCYIYCSVASEDPASVVYKEDGHPLSILILTSEYVAHFFPLVSLGEELVSRGHNVTMLGPVLEGREYLKELAESRGIRFLSSGVLPRSEYDLSLKAGQHNNSGTGIGAFVYRLWNATLYSNDTEHFQIKMRKLIDQQEPSDYIICDHTAITLLHYIRRVWNTSKVMTVFTPIPMTPHEAQTWTFPPILTPYTDDMSFTDRFVTLAIHRPIMWLLENYVLNMLMTLEPALATNERVLDFGLRHPVLYTTVTGFDWPRTILPLQHYVGPMLLSPPQPLDPPLLQWLDARAARSVIYIGMGTSATVTPALANTFVELSNNYSIVWSLKESNAHVLEGLDVDDAKMYVTPWVAQFSLLQHPSLLMVVVHCGISTVQEALYNSLPVLCIPYGFDQYDTALRVSTQGVGEQLNSNNVNSEEIAKVIDKVKEGEYRTAVKRVSRLLREAGGSKKAADLVELYATIGHEHGIPAYVRYNWGYIQYYNIDVWATISVIITVVIWSCVKMSICCCRCCCHHGNRKTKTD